MCCSIRSLPSRVIPLVTGFFLSGDDMNKKTTRQARVPKFEVITDATDQEFRHNDSDFIARRRDVMQFDLVSTEEHIAALRSQVAAALMHKERLEARIAGMTRSLARR